MQNHKYKSGFLVQNLVMIGIIVKYYKELERDIKLVKMLQIELVAYFEVQPWSSLQHYNQRKEENLSLTDLDFL